MKHITQDVKPPFFSKETQIFLDWIIINKYNKTCHNFVPQSMKRFIWLFALWAYQIEFKQSTFISLKYIRTASWGS